MWNYEKRLEYPINIKKKDINMAKYIISQYGGPQGELGAAIRYLNQRFTMPDDKGKALLTDIGCEELNHVEMICTMLYQLTKGSTIEEIEKAGLSKYYTEHGLDLFPENTEGVPFTSAYFAAVGDPVANISEDMAAEQKARAVYENLIDLTDDPDVIGPLLWLRQREIVHYARFKELFEYYNKKLKNTNKKVNSDFNNYNNFENMLDMDNNINTPSSIDITNGYLDNMNLDFTNMMMRRMF